MGVSGRPTFRWPFAEAFGELGLAAFPAGAFLTGAAFFAAGFEAFGAGLVALREGFAAFGGADFFGAAFLAALEAGFFLLELAIFVEKCRPFSGRERRLT